jgi:hypothetical protein
MFGVRKSTSWAKNPKEYLDEASEQLKSITGEGLNTNFWKNYTEEVLGKYPKPEKFQYGGLAGMLGEPTYQDDNHRMPYNKGGSISDVLPPDFDELDPEELMYIVKLLQAGEIPQYASGGRVPFKLGGKGKVLEGLAKLFDEFFPGTTKIGKRSKPYPEKVQEKMDLRKAIAGFHEREKAEKFKEMIKNKYQGRIDDDLLNKILVDDNPQRIAEVLATIDEALLMQGKGMGPDEIINTFKKKPTKHASGGRAGYWIGGKVGAGILNFLKNKKKIKEAVDDIFPTGDYKYDAQMAAESLVENNPKVFGGKLMDDLDDATRTKVYGAVIGPIQQNALMISRMKKATKPTKTLEGIEKTGTINISDPNVAEEFARFMKETDPVGHAKIQKVVDDANQQLELKRFKTKGKKGHATGGRVSLSTGGLAGMLGE